MKIDKIGGAIAGPGAGKGSVQALTDGFSQALSESLNNINALESKSGDMTQKMLTGELKEPHEAMIASAKASMALQFAMAVRNQVLRAYQEIIRMQ